MNVALQIFLVLCVFRRSICQTIWTDPWLFPLFTPLLRFVCLFIPVFAIALPLLVPDLSPHRTVSTLSSTQTNWLESRGRCCVQVVIYFPAVQISDNLIITPLDVPASWASEYQIDYVVVRENKMARQTVSWARQHLNHSLISLYLEMINSNKACNVTREFLIATQYCCCELFKFALK